MYEVLNYINGVDGCETTPNTPEDDNFTSSLNSTNSLRMGPGKLHTAVLSFAIIAVLLCRVQAAPIERRSTAPYVRLLSEETGLFVSVTEAGEVRANARGTGDDAKFYMTQVYGTNTHRFESVAYSGRYLMIDNESSTGLIGTEDQDEVGSAAPVLKCGVPSEGNDIFESINLGTPRLHVFKKLDTDCFMAFTEDGEVYGPCGLSGIPWEAEISVLEN